MTTATDKQRLRQRALAARGDLPAGVVRAAGEALAEHLCARPEWRQARSIHTYLEALPGELPTQPLVAAALDQGRHVIIPVVVEGRQLRHHHLTDLAGLQRGRFGLWEPERPRWVAEISTVDLILVPAAVLDRRGYRVGLGGGYYDRLLRSLPATILRVGFVYDAWLHPRVPTEPHDEAVDLIVTESGVYSITPPPPAPEVSG